MHDGRAAAEAFDPALTELGYQWARSRSRPRATREVSRGWDELIERWIASDIPLIIRKASKGRGAEHVHQGSLRSYTYADNTPANWVMELAIWEGTVPTLTDIRAMFEGGRMPLAMAFKKSEKEAVKYTTGGLRKALRPNAQGWKVCHIDPVSPTSDRKIEELDLEFLHKHFRRFLRPANMFLIPKRLGGVGEVDVFVDQIKQFEQQYGEIAP